MNVSLEEKKIRTTNNMLNATFYVLSFDDVIVSIVSRLGEEKNSLKSN